MTDAELRALERAWSSSRSAGDEEAYLRARSRAGKLDRATLEVAAYFGSEAAQEQLGADHALARKAPASGFSRFLEELPGSAELKTWGTLAAMRQLRAEGVSFTREAETAVAASATCLGSRGTPGEARARAAASEALAPLEARIALLPGYRPATPLALVFASASAPSGDVSVLDLAAFAIALHAVGRQPSIHWFVVGQSINGAMPGGAAVARRVRDAVRREVLPRALQAAPSDTTGDAPRPALLGPEAMTPEAAAAVLAVRGGARQRPPMGEARAVVRAFFVARGYREVRGVLESPDRAFRVKLLARAVQLLEGGAGHWRKVAATRGRELSMIDTAVHLEQLARGAGRRPP